MRRICPTRRCAGKVHNLCTTRVSRVQQQQHSSMRWWCCCLLVVVLVVVVVVVAQ
jgi:hypothetical protein